jgi:hypothetical protein
LIQVETRMRNIDSNTFLRRFDCCRFLFHRTFATTFATISAHLGPARLLAGTAAKGPGPDLICSMALSAVATRDKGMQDSSLLLQADKRPPTRRPLDSLEMT